MIPIRYKNRSHPFSTRQLFSLLLTVVVLVSPDHLPLTGVHLVLHPSVHILLVQKVTVIDTPDQGEEDDKEKKSYSHPSQSTHRTDSECLFLGLAHQQDYLQTYKESQFQDLANPKEEVSAEFRIEHQEEVEGLGDEEEVELGLGVVGQSCHYQAVPPQLSIPVQVVQSFCVGDLPVSPDVSLDEPEVYFMISISELDVQSPPEVFLFVFEPEEVREGVDRGDEEGYHCSCPRDARKGPLFSLIGDTGELQHGGEYQGEVLIEDDGVDIEQGSAMKGYLPVPQKVPGLGHLPCDILS